jgi:hypothetical protein
LIEDAVCPLDDKDYDEKKRELWEQGVDIIRSEEL